MMKNPLAPKPNLNETLFLGVTAAMVASNLMTMFRMFAVRQGWIDKTVPQAMEEWVLDKTGTKLVDSPVAHHAVDQVLHMGYAAGLGAVDGYLQKRDVNPYARGALIGVATWAFAGFVLLPALGVAKGAWNTKKEENLVNLGAHLLFGIGTALLTNEMVKQNTRGPAKALERAYASVG
jgi:predicted membrane-bound mannosyltransferase